MNKMMELLRMLSPFMGGAEDNALKAVKRLIAEHAEMKKEAKELRKSWREMQDETHRLATKCDKLVAQLAACAAGPWVKGTIKKRDLKHARWFVLVDIMTLEYVFARWDSDANCLWDSQGHRHGDLTWITRYAIMGVRDEKLL